MSRRLAGFRDAIAVTLGLVAVAGAAALAGCGEDATALPERAEFVERLVEGSDRTISQSTANCIYDRARDDADLLRAIAEDGDLTEDQAGRRDEIVADCLASG